MNKLLGALLLLASAGPATSATHTVPGDFPTVTAALGAAVSGDSVVVAAGTYSVGSGETFPLTVTSAGVHLIGSGMGVSILDAESTAGVLIWDTAVGGGGVRGFTLTGGAALHGGGIWVKNGNPEIAENLFLANRATGRGAGFRAHNTADVRVHHNVFWMNVDGDTTDTSDPHAAIVEGTATGTFEHNLVGRTDGNGLLTSGSATITARHNIFLENGMPGPPARGRGICWFSSAAPQVSHNLFFANQINALLWPAGGGDFSGAAANAFDPGDGIFGNLDGDPQLVDPDAGDFTLQASSPAIDAGDPSWPLDPDGTVADLGPFYFHQNTSSAPPSSAAAPVRVFPNPFSSRVSVDWSAAAGRSVRVQVFDVSGRLVRELSPRRGGSATWDGRDTAGRPAPAGVFLLKITSGDTTHTVPVVRMR